MSTSTATAPMNSETEAMTVSGLRIRMLRISDVQMKMGRGIITRKMRLGEMDFSNMAGVGTGVVVVVGGTVVVMLGGAVVVVDGAAVVVVGGAVVVVVGGAVVFIVGGAVVVVDGAVVVVVDGAVVVLADGAVVVISLALRFMAVITGRLSAGLNGCHSSARRCLPSRSPCLWTYVPATRRSPRRPMLSMASRGTPLARASKRGTLAFTLMLWFSGTMAGSMGKMVKMAFPMKMK